MVTKGSSIAAPFELDDSLAWYANGELFSFANPINETILIYADYISQYTITIHFIGVSKKDEILLKNAGEVVSLSEYAISGYDMLAISDEGREISALEVSRDAYINIIYSRR